MKNHEKNGDSRGGVRRNRNTRVRSSGGAVRKRTALRLRGVDDNGLELSRRHNYDGHGNQHEHHEHEYDSRYLFDIEHVIFLVAIADSRRNDNDNAASERESG